MQVNFLFSDDQKEEVKEKFKINLTEDSTREHNKFEKHIIKNKSGINETFIIKSLYNEDLINIYSGITVDSLDHDFNPIKVKKEFVESNYEYITRELFNIFFKAITECNSFKITQYITIKSTVDYRKSYFNSDISVLKTVKSLLPMINTILKILYHVMNAATRVVEHSPE